jgi:hypothetical protein
VQFLLFLLRPDEKEIKDHEHQDQRDKGPEATSGLSSRLAAGAHGVHDVDQNDTSLSVFVFDSKSNPDETVKSPPTGIPDSIQHPEFYILDSGVRWNDGYK